MAYKVEVEFDMDAGGRKRLAFSVPREREALEAFVAACPEFGSVRRVGTTEAPGDPFDVTDEEHFLERGRSAVAEAKPVAALRAAGFRTIERVFVIDPDTDRATMKLGAADQAGTEFDLAVSFGEDMRYTAWLDTIGHASPWQLSDDAQKLEGEFESLGEALSGAIQKAIERGYAPSVPAGQTDPRMLKL